MVWCSHLFQNFPQLVVILTIKGLGVVNKAEVDVFLELSCFFDDLTDVGNSFSDNLQQKVWNIKVKVKETNTPR